MGNCALNSSADSLNSFCFDGKDSVFQQTKQRINNKQNVAAVVYIFICSPRIFDVKKNYVNFCTTNHNFLMHFVQESVNLALSRVFKTSILKIKTQKTSPLLKIAKNSQKLWGGNFIQFMQNHHHENVALGCSRAKIITWNSFEIIFFMVCNLKKVRIPKYFRFV
jgi:hypothetical protein